jgi:hypothetical protein
VYHAEGADLATVAIGSSMSLLLLLMLLVCLGRAGTAWQE